MIIKGINQSMYNTNLNTSSNSTSEAKQSTEIKYDNGYKGKIEDMMEKLTEHYKKANEINKSFSNPVSHIADKYMNRFSKYFRADMTEQQRSIAMSNELRMLREGKIYGLYTNDYVLKGYEPIHGDSEEIKKQQFNRAHVDSQIQALLEKNSISIPNGKSIKFTINPYDYSLSVSGLNDEGLKEQIEAVLNSAENSKNLFYHIFSSRTEDSEQFTKEKYDKFQLFREIQNNTGYDLRTLKNENGRFYTEDGRDILDIYKTSSSIPKQYRGDVAGYYKQILENIGARGFNNVPDLYLSIEYKDGFLYDVGQSKGYGPGQTEWIK